ncbi:MAG: restriction endonuclease subunit S [Terrimicrobiaceae bacterium]
MSDIPATWAKVKIEDLFEFSYGKALSKSNRRSAGRVPVYGSNGITGYHDEPLIDGPCILVGRKGAAGKVSKALNGCWPIDTTYYVQVPCGLDFEFCFHLFQVQRFEKFEKSTAIPSLSRDDAYGQEIVVPPLPEQRRIVTKIEELFSELDKGIENLKQALAQLAVYRQALLKHAFEGKLTADWRAANADKLETPEQLLSRICAERKTRYEKQLAEWKAALQEWESGDHKESKPSNPRKPADAALLSAEELARLPELPTGWTWLRLV